MIFRSKHIIKVNEIDNKQNKAGFYERYSNKKL